MVVIFVSQCSKRALTETRRILDQFAERTGHRTWQTPITEAGLLTVRKLLRKTARKNSAVACHRVRGQSRTELAWIVGDASQFNPRGVVPTNTTERNILRSESENDWHTRQVICDLAQMAGLFHDFGKATQLFQAKLRNRSKKPQSDPYRHEWVSLRMFMAFVDDDDDKTWLLRLVDINKRPDDAWMSRLQRDGLDKSRAPFRGEASSLVRALGWLIVSHHRLPDPGSTTIRRQREAVFESISADWCGSPGTDDRNRLESNWTIKEEHIPTKSRHWREHAASAAQRLLKNRDLLAADGPVTNPFVQHVARMVLMLSDHHYSSLDAGRWASDPTYLAYANTKRDDASGTVLNQTLDEHLIGVGQGAKKIARQLPQIEQDVARITRHKGFSRRTSIARFAWQNKAYELAVGLRQNSEQHGFFGVNMASTGCGKTLGNGRIMYGLADPEKGARFSIALGLRTLTLQTGQAFRERLNLDEDQLGVLVGGQAVRELFELAQSDARPRPEPAVFGSESAESLMDDGSFVHYESVLGNDVLSQWLGGKRGRGATTLRKLIHAPIVVCTIDHLMPACEGTRGGKQIGPMLRLFTSDLVLDEPDDFGLEDLPALARLVHLAGLLGSRVLLSSATLPPSIVTGLFDAYLSGRKLFRENRGTHQSRGVTCAWFDEHSVTSSEEADLDGFAKRHGEFAAKRVEKLTRSRENEMRRRAQIAELSTASKDEDAVLQQMSSVIRTRIYQLHGDHYQMNHDGFTASVGLVRMANIDPMIGLAQLLAGSEVPEGSALHLCVYHSRFPLVMRSRIESALDSLLSRHDPNALWTHPVVRNALEETQAKHHVFVVLASPVAEVGRDHDYDWAIVEPSSMRSIIQLAGRVRRHRSGDCGTTNLVLLDANRKALMNTCPAFTRPGFEPNRGHPVTMSSHRLSDLLRTEQLVGIDACPRIIEHDPLDPQSNLVDLEHFRLRETMLDQGPNARTTNKNATNFWTTKTHLTAIEQRCTPFRKQTEKQQRYIVGIEDEEFQFLRVELDGRTAVANSIFVGLELTLAANVSTWPEPSYALAIEELCERLDLSEERCIQNFGYVDLPESREGSADKYHHHPVLGFTRSRC